MRCIRPWAEQMPRAALGALAGIVLVGCSAAGGASQAPQAAPDEQRAPSFEMTTLQGERLTLDGFAGKAVVLNFWASWCVPCRAEMPLFETTYRAYQDRGVMFVGAAVEDDPISAGQFGRDRTITYPLGLDDGTIAHSYQLVGLPSTMFIGRDGKLVRQWSGILDQQQLTEFVEEIAG